MPDWTALVHHVVAGFPIVFIYIFLIPGSIAYTLVRQRKAQTLFVHQTQYNPQHTIRFGFMFAGYREGYEFWECVVMLRKCAFVLLSVFLRQYGASPQVVAASIVLFLATSVHLQYRPYNDPKHNEIESVGLHACQLQLLVALISNMIGRVNPLVVQSPIGPISTAVVIYLSLQARYISFGSRFCGLFDDLKRPRDDGGRFKMLRQTVPTPLQSGRG